ncbi:Uma2 family endonuclease [Kumtagia ephedrae]|jgi:Uma2 family endonuclease|uniref:Uma2 family endonuclease n=1 Tax=Kumtagia ephedrae TaxID=2116701 RepID=A0A2P7S1L0_9HYPH|nr:Uma2 family endonuclease [Mesorhizobium ephedrae]PSJ56357.1 Uma2 family endonuclease [Mesorhizobium ephedrae]
MNIQSKLPTTADEFLRWNEGREGKREFVRGRVVEMMINVTRNHWRIATRLTHQLVLQLGLEAYDIGATDFGVRTRDGVRYPDVLVEPTAGDGKALATSAPLLVAEILSPASVAEDFGTKASDYLALASLRHYLVLAQDEPRLWLWSRADDGAWTEPDMIEGRGETVSLAGLGITLQLSELYAGIEG